MSTPGVRSLPTLPLQDLLGEGARCLPPPLDRGSVSFWFSGRVALYQAIVALGLNRGDAVALPAFSCGSELDPFFHAGLVPRFFRVTDMLDPEPRSFQAASNGAAAALVTHYFGFAADIEPARRACAAQGIPLIEDCAHALYSRDGDTWLGAGADASVFSIVKTLPVPDGGALVLNSRAGGQSPGTDPPPARLVARRTYSLLIRHLQAHPARPVSWLAHLPRAVKRRLGLVAPEPATPGQDALGREARFEPGLERAGISPRSLRLLARAPHERIRAARRDNYATLVSTLDGMSALRPLFPVLGPGTCPLALPVVARDPDAFRRMLAAGPALGVKQMWPWFHPGVPWTAFPAEAELKRSVFILPVHQSLHRGEIDRIIAALRNWSRA
jgi:dTDP-4-amino-4,6-dideoxygalactose transaminase